MGIFTQLALLGLGTGAIYALLGQGIVLIFRGSGVLNLSHGALAMAAAFLYYQLHEIASWPGLPAASVAVAAVVMIGLLTDQLLLRRLRHAASVTRLIGTLGVLLVLQGAALLKWGSNTIIAPPVFPSRPVAIFGTTVPLSAVWMLGLALVLTFVLTVVWRYTRLGWLTIAASENKRACEALGWSPEFVSGATWAAGAALAGIAGIVIAPTIQLNVSQTSYFIIPALAAALVGGFASFPLTLAGGLLVGATQAEVAWYVHVNGASDAFPFLAIALVMAVRGEALPSREHLFDRLPEVGRGLVRPTLIIPVSVLVGALTSLAFGANLAGALAVQFSVAIILLSIVVLTGYAGQLSLAQYALAGIGALTAARLISTQGWPFELTVPAAVATAIVVGILFSLPAMRTRGVSLAVLTLALGVATQAVIFENASIAGGWAGNNIGQIRLFGWNIDFLTHPQRYALVVFVAFVLCAVAVDNLRRGRSGRRWLALRANERAAAASGVNVFVAKLQAFAVSGALAGLGGLLLAFQTRAVTVNSFDPVTSINAVAQSVIGGVGYVTGASIGATIAPGALASLIGEHFSGIDKYLPLASGVLLLVTLLANPNGIAHTNAELARRVRRRFRGAHHRTPIVIMPEGHWRRVPPRRLVIEALSVGYGGVLAVQDVGLDVGPGEVVGLIGPNGAGKTSLMDAVSGFARYSGRVRLNEDRLDGQSPHRRARAGLIRSFQALELFEDLTVYENLQVASDNGDPRAIVTDLVRPGNFGLSPMAANAVHEFGLIDHLIRRPGELSYGQRRLVAIARAVALEPSVLLLDEPASGLNQAESRELASLVRRLANECGMALLLVEHDMDFVMGLCDRIVVIDFGRKIADGVPAEVRRNGRAIAAYLGTDEPRPRSAPAVTAGAAGG